MVSPVGRRNWSRLPSVDLAKLQKRQVPWIQNDAFEEPPARVLFLGAHSDGNWVLGICIICNAPHLGRPRIGNLVLVILELQCSLRRPSGVMETQFWAVYVCNALNLSRASWVIATWFWLVMWGSTEGSGWTRTTPTDSFSVEVPFWGYFGAIWGQCWAICF